MNLDPFTRRLFFRHSGIALGSAAFASLLKGEDKVGSQTPFPHFPPRAKRVIYLCQSGGPAQMDLFDHKPELGKHFDKDLPDSVRKGQRLTTQTSGQNRFPVAPSVFGFKQFGQSGAWVSELMPYTAQIADRLCFVKSVHTDAINHDPAITFLQTGSERPGRPSIGAWLSYGLGSLNQNLPGFVVMTSATKTDGQPLYKRLWGSGFLPSHHQGVRLRGTGAPVLYLDNPPGVSRTTRRQIIDDVNAMNRLRLKEEENPELSTRISQYELAFRMQQSVPEITQTGDEPARTWKLYGEDARKRGTFAANCLQARRLLERGVRFVQLFHRGWDQHDNLPRDHQRQCVDTDQATAGLILDLEERGMLEDTLVIWGGEFGRTAYCQGKLTRENYGRDHHPRCFTMWLAGGGIAAGTTYGETDDFSYNVAANPVHIHDLNATILRLLGIDHLRLTHRFQGRNHRLTDVHGRVISGLMT
ncbi:MAG TPA: sulfatase [Verrucomicrobiales bacterium]|nr:sulfatase [Verrucomicrobiales bacterium]